MEGWGCVYVERRWPKSRHVSASGKGGGVSAKELTKGAVVVGGCYVLHVGVSDRSALTDCGTKMMIAGFVNCNFILY